MKLFGLLGFPLGHSFSKGYFTEKFEKLGIAATHRYEKFEIESAGMIADVLRENPEIAGLNVTIPHKKNIIQYLDVLDSSAQRVGAVNVIKRSNDGRLIGFNSDYYGFKSSLEIWFKSLNRKPASALVLGNGGAAKAVLVALEDLEISYLVVTRKPNEGDLQYEDLTEQILESHHLIINTTPLGTFPRVDERPPLPYGSIDARHLFYDLVYNPAETAFMKAGIAAGGQAHNGLPMLHLQAEKAWEIWNS